MVAPGSDISLHSLGGLWITPRQPPSSSARPPAGAAGGDTKDERSRPVRVRWVITC
jgi:hypothetical protein